MSQMAKDYSQLIIHHDDSLTNGGPDNYKKWYQQYDDYFVSYINWQSPKSVASMWKRYHCSEENDTTGLNTSGLQKHKIFDAGCGTGLVAQEILKLNMPVEIYGGDYSPDMLSIAREKNCYHDLKVLNLKEELPYADESFDSIVCSGVFLQGHCGPECIPNIMKVLKRGGYFITTVRVAFYQSVNDKWAEEIRKSGSTLVEKTSMPYFDENDKDNAQCVMLVIKKDNSC